MAGCSANRARRSHADLHRPYAGHREGLRGSGWRRRRAGQLPEKAHHCSIVHTTTLERSVDIRSHASSPPGMSTTSRCGCSTSTGYIHSMPSGHVRIATVRALSAASKASRAV
ncbi:hypothetical protein ACOBQB_09760 [Streptomyces sp. G5(2025)]|uniref:hypothetical protein n=1 Tax=Streptomyces sp. G5(2025) TaxID=3406628 RepID=UPI003C19D4AE